TDLRALLPRRSIAGPQGRGDRARPRHRQAPDAGDGRIDRGGERPGGGHHLPDHPGVRLLVQIVPAREPRRRVWRASRPSHMKLTICAMLVAWSPMRSRYLAMKVMRSARLTF